MRVSPLRSIVALAPLGLALAPLGLALACNPQMTAAPASTPAAAATTTTAPTTEGAGSTNEGTESTAQAAPVAQSSTGKSTPAPPVCRKDEGCGSANAGPPPLRAGKAGGDPFAAPKSTKPAASKPCTKDTLKDQLQKIVDACRKDSTSICGDLVLHTKGGDAGDDNVSVDFNLGTSGDTLGFSKCVVARINNVTWECATQGDDITLDLGCKL